MEGIKESKEALEFLAEVINAFDKSLSDGALSIADAMAFLPVIVSAPAALGNLPSVLSEAYDYSSEEIKELSNAFNAKLKLRDAKLKSNIESGVEMALNLAKLLSGLKRP